MRDTLLFDLDGTLTDTDALHFEAYARLLGPYGKSVDHATYKARIMGFTNESIMLWLFPDADASERKLLADRKEALFRELAGTGMKRARGLSELLDWAAGRRLKTAVVTNAPRQNAELMLNALGLAARFDALVIGDELARGKPDPLPYAHALKLLGATPKNAMAFEDSGSGIASASGAGVDTVGLTTGLTPARLIEAGAVGAVPDFADPWLIARLRAEYGSAPLPLAA
jgi:HAD superfamily hydrolase (TIGR01509 family)